MRREHLLAFIICFIVILFSASCAQFSPIAGRTANPVAKESLPALANQKISNSKILVKRNPNSAKSHLALAAAYLEKVRETGDYTINKLAENSINNAIKIDPENFDAKLLQTQIFLSEHEFAKALELTRVLEAIRNDNPAVLAAKTDALTELGRYDEAVKAAQEFVDTRPNAASYTRVAHLRSLFGDPNGAIEARIMAIRMADPYHVETFAWYHSELGKEYFDKGDFENAGKAFEKALSILPEYHWALAGKGKVLAAKAEFAEAAEIYERLRKRVPETSREIFLGDIYVRMGQAADAEKVYREVAAREKAKEKGDMHRIALLWADHDNKLDEALDLARADRKANNDLAASDTYGWVLYKKGNYREAKAQMKDALRLKSKFALYFYHLGMIENGLGNKKEAIRNLEMAISINPSFDLIQAPEAKSALRELRK